MHLSQAFWLGTLAAAAVVTAVVMGARIASVYDLPVHSPTGVWALNPHCAGGH